MSEEKINKLLQDVISKPLSSLSIGQLQQISRIQFQKIKLAGKFGYPYNPDLFIRNPAVDKAFREFVQQRGIVKPVFLILANIGMGKTWNAVHLGHKIRDEEAAIQMSNELVGQIISAQNISPECCSVVPNSVK